MKWICPIKKRYLNNFEALIFTCSAVTCNQDSLHVSWRYLYSNDPAE